MGIELGRISGPLLAENLLRNGTDLAFETNLLYLDVNNGRIGIKTDTPSRTLSISGITHFPVVQVTTQFDPANLTFLNNRIQAPRGDGKIYFVPNQSSDPTVVVNELRTDNLKLSNSSIVSLVNNDDINLAANGTGQVIFNTASVEVLGSLHATGDITWDGDVIIGDGNTDNVTFNAEVNSDIIPNYNNTYDLGTSARRWNHLYSNTVATDAVIRDTAVVNGIDLLLTQGHTWYVSINGSDTNRGNHLHSTYLSLKYALSVAVAGDNIVIFPGTYTEIFPLTVPAGVSVSGSGIRSVIIQPTAGTVDKDAFLLNGETTVSHLTVKGVNYNSIDNTGYAFRFANNIIVTTRSPYVQNISVINTAPTAGPGALVDGSVANSASAQASMLLHSVTFIVPGADGITATNGARVEWLNSFTYFANRGIYLTQGALGFASQGVKFGAEIRSIGSVNVYGTYGAVADGANTLGYLVGHNFGYIGTGTDSQNDDRLTQQANEVVELNSGKIYYDSMDHKGNYRIGDIFLVDQLTGNVTFNAQSINFGAAGNITLTGPSTETIIDATKVQTGNIRVHDNNIDSLVGPVNFLASNGSTYLNTDVTVTGLVNVSGDVGVNGNVYLGDTEYDIISVFPKLTQNINPGSTDIYSLGSRDTVPFVWNTAFLTGINVDNVTQLTNNTVSILTANTNLRLVAAGTGKLQISSTDVQVNNNLTTGGLLTVAGTSYLKDPGILGTTTLTGNIGQSSGNTNITGLFDNVNISVTGVGSYLQVASIRILDNTISTTTGNLDLQFVANGTGGVTFDDKLKIVDNVISNIWPSATTDAQKSIIFAPNGTSNVVLNATAFFQIPYSNASNRVITVNGEIRQNSISEEYEGHSNTGITSLTKLISGDKKTYITPELSLGNNDNIFRFYVNNSVRATLDVDKLATSVIQVDNFVLSGNTINNTVTGSDTVFTPTGTGSINLNGIKIKDNAITNGINSAISINSTGIGYVKFTGKGAVVFPYGDTGQRRLLPEVGETRYNSELNYMEVYNGTLWIPATGLLGNASMEEVIDIIDLWGLVLG